MKSTIPTMQKHLVGVHLEQMHHNLINLPTEDNERFEIDVYLFIKSCTMFYDGSFEEKKLVLLKMKLINITIYHL